MFEVVTALSVLLKKFKFEFVCELGEVEMIIGVMIYMKKGLFMKFKRW